MAVKIRMRQQGRKNHQTFRLVACDTHVKRDGVYLENLGWYDPFLAENNAKVDEERLVHWLDRGAELTERAKHLIARTAPGVLKHWNDKNEAKKAKAAAQARQRRKGAKSPVA